jgi:DNA-binding MarR family transcriptional regulator
VTHYEKLVQTEVAAARERAVALQTALAAYNQASTARVLAERRDRDARQRYIELTQQDERAWQRLLCANPKMFAAVRRAVDAVTDNQPMNELSKLP